MSGPVTPSASPSVSHSVSRARLVLGAIGVAVTAYGAYLVLHDRLDQLLGTVVWLGGGVVAHDFVLVPLVLLLVALVGRLLPWAWRGPAAVTFVLLGTLTVVAVPFLGRFGALPDNPTLLDRDYVTGYAVYVVLVLLAVVLGTLLLRRRRRPHVPGGRADDTPGH